MTAARETRTRVAVIGTGQWAVRHHLPALAANPLVSISGVSDRSAERAQIAAQRFDVTAATPDTLLDPDVTDAVVIATPAAAHATLASRALAAGLHVLVEKPFTIASEDAVTLARLARSTQRHLVVGYTYQFTEGARQLRALLKEGRIGELVLVDGLFASMVEALYRAAPEEYDGSAGFGADIRPAPDSYHPSQSGGGQAQTQLTHDAGLLSWLTGQAWTQVAAFTSQRGLPVDLINAVAFTLGQRTLGTYSSTGNLRAGSAPQHNLRLFGAAGWAALDLTTGALRAHYDDTDHDLLRAGDTDPYPSHAPVNALISLARGETMENNSPADSAARAVAFIEAVYQSARTRAIVSPATTECSGDMP